MNAAGREIFWNIPAPGLFYLLAVLAVAVSFCGFAVRIRLVLRGPEVRTAVRQRLGWHRVLGEILTHRVSGVRHPSGLWHLPLLYGFGALLVVTALVMVAYRGFPGVFQGRSYSILSALAEWAGLGLAFGASAGLVARARARRYGGPGEDTPGSSAALIVLLILVLSGFLLEGLRLRLDGEAPGVWGFPGILVSRLFSGLPPEPVRQMHFLTWWGHSLLALFFVGWLPFSSLRHLFVLPVNRALKTLQPAGALPPLDLQDAALRESTPGAVRLGIERAADLTRLQRLGLLACVNCGRCEEVCPACRTGQPLSPRRLVQDLAACLSGRRGAAAGWRDAGAARQVDNLRADRVEDRSKARDCGAAREGVVLTGHRSSNTRAAGCVSTEALWACRLCLACEYSCPAGLEHVSMIGEMRRAEVLGHGRLPHEAAAALRHLGRTGNPYGSPPAEMEAWVREHRVPCEPGGRKGAFLLWPGCFPPGDDHKPRVLANLVNLLRRLDTPFFVLRGSEICCGDPARILGEEDLFQNVAAERIARMRASGVRQILVHCPHCYTVLKDLYPFWGAEFSVVHTSEFLAGALGGAALESREPGIAGPLPYGDSRRGNPRKPEQRAKIVSRVTFHDPCFLGRYHGNFDGPRAVLASIPGLEVLEARQNRGGALCCGGGGGHFLMDLDAGERPAGLRLQQLLCTGADTLAVSCGFCAAMFEDALRKAPPAGQVRVADWLELLGESLDPW